MVRFDSYVSCFVSYLALQVAVFFFAETFFLRLFFHVHACNKNT